MAAANALSRALRPGYGAGGSSRDTSDVADASGSAFALPYHAVGGGTTGRVMKGACRIYLPRGQSLLHHHRRAPGGRLRHDGNRDVVVTGGAAGLRTAREVGQGMLGVHTVGCPAEYMGSLGRITCRRALLLKYAKEIDQRLGVILSKTRGRNGRDCLCHGNNPSGKTKRGVRSCIRG